MSTCCYVPCSLSLEHDRRDIQERNEAMTALFRDIQDLNSMAKEMAIQVDTQQDQISKHNSFVSSVKCSESKQGLGRSFESVF